MLVLDNVWKSYPTRSGLRSVLEGVNAVIRPGDAVGILGRNGAGKSTLLRILSGVEVPSAGRVIRQMSVSWPLASGFGIQASLSGADNARFIARIYGLPVPEVLEAVESFAELGPYFREPARTYSAGMMGRLLLGLSFAVDFDCYLIDEAVSAGDARFVERTHRMLQERLSRAAMLMVSHSAEHLRQYCRTAAVLHQGRLEFHEDLDEAIAVYNTL
ncbi:ABC transporter ATP-binding protein [Roseomonas sp. OT10]|uniref:ABC transporter ATP-binding protein n=1 Tax=Roseomonas cutis TaxID=2897332 RepID=UPI001E581D82|nr:ABC transporter ATP-binding protein [Roseomonas sp. OT10]UFN48696.1 ABC transporter ATP-binding protein [Roseomonas sp. OT10]